MTADELAKSLFQYLLANCSSSELRNLGWSRFVKFDLPETDDARALAAASVCYLLVDEDGRQINHDDRILYATLAFVQSIHGGPRPTSLSGGLTRILATTPVNEAEVIRWFTKTFPHLPDPK